MIKKKKKKKSKVNSDSIITTILGFLGALVAVLIYVLFDLVKYLFNLALVHASLQQVVSVAPLEDILKVLEDFFTSINLSFFTKLYKLASGWFEWLNILQNVGAGWNCGGTLSMMGPVILILGTMFLVFVLARETLLRFAIATQARKTDSFLKQRVYQLISTSLTTGLLYLLQSGVITMTQVVQSIWNIKRSCSDLDNEVLQIGAGISVVAVAMFVYFAVLLFAGVQMDDDTGLMRKLTVDWVKSFIRLVTVSVGVWNDSTIEGFHIFEKADKFDQDGDDLDNQREKAMSVTGQSRGIIWLPLPYGVFLTKLAEGSNISPALILSKKNLDLYNPTAKRRILWILNVAKVLSLFVIAVIATPLVAYISIGLMVLAGLISVFYPNPKEKEERAILDAIKAAEEAANEDEEE
jgi:hypothetical protein